MASRALVPATAPKTYADLRRGVEAVVFAGRAEIESAWLRTYHDTGRLIHEHLLLHHDRAEYGAQVFKRLSADTRVSRRVLYECVQLYRYFPIVRTSAQLTRSHYQLLCQVSERNERESLLKQTVKYDWSVAELTARVRSVNAAREINGTGGESNELPAGTVELLKPKRGRCGLHLVVDRGGDGLVVDLGFKLYRALTPGEARGLEKGDIVALAEGAVRRVDGTTKADLFTYRAAVRRIVDGDTLVIAIEVAPAVWLEEKLRLRGVDCPELATAPGKAAKRFVDGSVPIGRTVVITTTKPDKYDRYLADVFVPVEGAEKSAGDNGTGERAEVFLNNALLEQGLAERKEVWEFGDWE